MSSQEPGDLGYNGFPVSLFYLMPIDSDGFSDPNVTIALKNLTKKNGITKEKRLAEFLKMLEERSFDIQDYAILQCWLQLYPRVAIDTSKSVRSLAHQIQATYMRLYGAKEFSKYLKTSLPVWIQGLYDEKSIAQFVRADLLKCFTNDQEKVDVKIWVIFQEQIINYCFCVLVHESATSITDERADTAEEVAMKYDRAMTGALSMLLKMMRLVNESQLTLNESSLAQADEIFSSDKLWDCLGSCSSSETMNNALFKALLSVTAELFTLCNDEPTPFALCLSDLKSVYKVISKKFIKQVKLSPNSSMSTLVLSPVIIPLIDTLTKLTDFPEIAGKKCSPKIKKNIWQIGGSKSYSRFKDYVKLGPCNSDPSYYSKLEALFKSIEAAKMKTDDEFPFLDFTSSKDAKTVFSKMLLPSVVSHKGMNAFSYKFHGSKCIFAVFDLFDKEALEGLAEHIFFTLLDTIAIPPRREEQARKACFSLLASFFTTQELNASSMNEAMVEALVGEGKVTLGGHEIENQLTEVFFCYSETVRRMSYEAFENLLAILLEKIEEIYEPQQLHKVFDVLLKIYNSSEESVPAIEEWIVSSLASFISEEFVDLPLQFLKSAVQRGVVSQHPEVIADFYAKLSADAPEQTLKLMSIAGTLDSADFRKLQEQAPELLDYVSELSLKSQRSKDEDEVVLQFLFDPTITNNLFENASSDKLKIRIISYLVANDSISLDDSHLKALIETSLKNVNVSDCQMFLNMVIDKDTFSIACFDVITASKETDDVANFLAAHSDKVPKKLIEDSLTDAIRSIDLSSLAIANSLGQNIYLFSQPSEVKIVPSILSIHTFLTAYINASKTNDDEIKLLHAFASQYVQDYWFLTSKEKEELENYDTFLGKDFVENVFSNPGSGPFQALEGKGPFGPHEFYLCRLIYQLLQDSFDQMSLAEFEQLDIQYVKLANSPLKLATFLTCASKFIGKSSKLDRIRNYVFGEILGVKASGEILEKGSVWLCLATNFLNGEDPYSIIPNPKLGLLMNTLSSWLESDIAYDSEFNSMRSLLAIFFSRLILISSDPLPDKMWEVAVDLCLNNLGTAQSDYNLHALKYFSMKLLVTLTNNVDQNVYPQWSESKSSITEELVDLLFNVNKNEEIESGQSAILVNDLLARILRSSKLSKSILEENASKLYSMLSSSKHTTLQRVATMFLKTHIAESQQEITIEYSLSRSNLGEDPYFGEDLLKFYPTLIETISKFHHFEDESESYSKLLQYLWSFLLIFEHFQNSTVSMRAEYINQLKKDGNIEKLFDVIIDAMPISDSKYLNTLVNEPVEKLAKVEPSNCLIQDYDVAKGYVGRSMKEEAEFLLAHIYYLSFHYFGAFAEQWFNDIRDLQLKQQVQKFSVRFISPLLISTMLNEVEQSKDKLVASDENLSIKVNKVTNEVKSVYLIDEQNMEMVVKIPDTFPLAKVNVEGPMRLGVKENQWKAWLLASQRVITLTNGSIIDCIEIFQRNVNLHFSGFEECAICYSILHQDRSLPSKNCPVCSNKFHAACLYKWFKSSGSSTCPLCRSAFNFKANRD